MGSETGHIIITKLSLRRKHRLQSHEGVLRLSVLYCRIYWMMSATLAQDRGAGRQTQCQEVQDKDSSEYLSLANLKNNNIKKTVLKVLCE